MRKIQMNYFVYGVDAVKQSNLISFGRNERFFLFLQVRDVELLNSKSKTFGFFVSFTLCPTHFLLVFLYFAAFTADEVFPYKF